MMVHGLSAMLQNLPVTREAPTPTASAAGIPEVAFHGHPPALPVSLAFHS